MSAAIKTLVGVSSSSNDLVKKVELPQKMKKSTSPKNTIHCFSVEKGCCWKSGTYQHQLGPLMGQTNGKVLKHYSPDWSLAQKLFFVFNRYTLCSTYNGHVGQQGSGGLHSALSSTSILTHLSTHKLFINPFVLFGDSLPRLYNHQGEPAWNCPLTSKKHQNLNPFQQHLEFPSSLSYKTI